MNLNKNKKIVLTSTQYMGYGGAATNVYKIIKLLQKKKYNVYGIFFHNNLNVNYNPDNLENIFIFDSKYFLNNTINLIYDELIDMYKKIGEPDIILAKNYDAPKFIKMLYPFSKIYYLLSGLNHFPKFYKDTTAFDFLNLEKINGNINEEKYVLNICESVIINSPLTQKLFNKIYDYDIDKQLLIDTTLLTYNDHHTDIKLELKTYDIVISCSRLDRVDKNNLWLINLLEDDYFIEKKILIVGNNNEKFKILNLDITYHNLISNEKMIDLFKQTKILLFPSLYDSNSNTVLEALINKCFPITTKNVGNSYYLHNDFLCSEINYDVSEWKNKIKYLLENYEEYFYEYKTTNINCEINNNYKLLINLIERTNKNKIIVTSTQYPGYGGAATNCYNIHNYLLKNDYDSVCVFLENYKNENVPNFNPANLPNTYLFERNKLDKNFIEKINPDVILCKNYYCPHYFKTIFKNKYKIYYLVSGSIHATYNADFGHSYKNILQMDENTLNIFLDEIGKSKNNANSIKMELNSINESDFILPNSKISYDLMTKIYKNNKHKILSVCDTSIYTELMNDHKFNDTSKYDKEYDICFVCSTLDRKVKNFDFVYKLFSCDELNNCKKIVVGKNNYDKYDFSNSNIIHIDYLENFEVLSLLKKSKILILPSLFDASPNIANEANKCGCKIISSDNVGNIKKNYIVIDNYDITVWSNTIKNILLQK